MFKCNYVRKNTQKYPVSLGYLKKTLTNKVI